MTLSLIEELELQVIALRDNSFFNCSLLVQRAIDALKAQEEEQTSFDLAVDNHARAMARVAELEREVERQNMNCLNLHQQLEDMKAQPSGVVHHDLIEALKFYANGDHLLLADPDAWDTCSGEPINFLHDDAGTASVEDGSIAKAALDSLNSSPVSDGNDAQYPPCDYCAEPLSYHPWHGSGLINGVESRHIHACDKCRHLLPSVSACGVDERAAFETWYETTYGISLEPEFRANHFIGYVNDKANHRWTAWQARAALSAPSHGELSVLREYRTAIRNFNDSHGVETDTLDEAVEIARKAETRLEAAEKACHDFYAGRDPAPSHGEQVYQFQCREIGEGDWGPCDHSRYMYCQKSPEHDTRVVQVGLQAPSHGEQVRVVPVEPTEAMRKAAQDKLAGEGLIVTDWLIHTAYAAMLGAAPSAGSQEQGE